ncbi:MAG: alcohol dehydrogenase catalytic domain-containing protein [Thermaerobacter sp.]|nr:alcohol dehydrogenase catalytic domain-containing protein [Thermaerobacter sp.]
MEALVWEGPERMTCRSADDPVAVVGHVVVRVAGVGVCGSELGAYLGHNELRRPPLVMGHEFSGVVVEVGAGVDPVWNGTSVVVNPLVTCGTCRWCRRGERQLCRTRRIIGIDFPGAFAEQVAVPVESLWPVHRQDQDLWTGALVEPLACAVRATGQAAVQPGDAVLVYGAGIIGLMSAWMARRRGATSVWLVDANPVRLAQGSVWGADRALDATTEDVVGLVRRAYPDGVDRVIDAVGLAGTRREGLELLTRGGRLVLVGLHEPATSLDGNRVVRDETEVVGSFCYRDQDFTVAANLWAAGALPGGDGWLDRRPLSAGDRAFQEQARGPAPFAKIVLDAEGRP